MFSVSLSRTLILYFCVIISFLNNHYVLAEITPQRPPPDNLKFMNNGYPKLFFCDQMADAEPVQLDIIFPPHNAELDLHYDLSISQNIMFRVQTSPNWDWKANWRKNMFCFVFHSLLDAYDSTNTTKTLKQ